MFQGTGSDVGKSLIVTGLCRAYARRGLRVRPFKPQNMSNNAAVTPDGGEIGRAQALQARACGVPPGVHMNPVLLKPQTDVGAQVVVHGRVVGNARARDYHALKPRLLPKVLESFRRLGSEADLVLIEGAGSPAEVNLREGDIANMGFAEAARVAVILVGDVDRGGVIASLVGTWMLLSGAERRQVNGYIVNRFRGDASLFEDAMNVIHGRTGLDCMGIVPYFGLAARLPAEDAVVLDSGRETAVEHRLGGILIAVPRLSRIANFDDLDPLRAEPDVRVDVVEPGRPIPVDADLIVLPGSKATLADLAFVRGEGWDVDIRAAVRRGGHVLGLCAGYQMLGRRVSDPMGVEGPPGSAEGLGLLDVETVIGGDKSLSEVAGVACQGGEAVRGYEMHMGRTEGADRARPFLELETGTGRRPDGAVSADGRVMGTYVHGLLTADGFRAAFLARLRPGRRSEVAYEAGVEAALDALAAHLEQHLDLDRMLALAGPEAGC
ncbi:MAG: cobyric acid synthase [Alphaproteobacteria bacterium]